MKKIVKPAKKTAMAAEPAPAKKMKLPTAKPMAKSAKKPEPKVKLSVSKKSEKIEVIALEETAVVPSEDEEEEMEISAASSSAGANEAGLALAAASETTAGSLKNFRHHPDIENFYRFIYENDLRYEALEIIDLMTAQRSTLKTVKAAKTKAH